MRAGVGGKARHRNKTARNLLRYIAHRMKNPLSNSYHDGIPTLVPRILRTASKSLSSHYQQTQRSTFTELEEDLFPKFSLACCSLIPKSSSQLNSHEIAGAFGHSACLHVLA